MELLVPLEGGRVGEGAGAVVAGEGLLAGVGAAVLGKAGGLGEGCAVVRALVGPLACAAASGA